jgi:hypothetical protein
MTRPLALLTLASLSLLGLPLGAAAQVVQQGLCDSQLSTQVVGGVQVSNCRNPIISLIQNEKVGIDVAFWFMEDQRYSTALINWHKANPNLPIRILVDERANSSKPANATVLQLLKDAGIPMREKVPDPTHTIQILHFKMMLFHGQNVVEFSKANYSPLEFVPNSSTDFFDEAIFFTNDDRLTNSFRRRFDDLWVNTTVYQDYANITSPPTRRYPLYPIDPAMNFVPLQDFANRAKGRINAEPSGGQIDAIVFRVTDHVLPDAVISAVGRGVNVRIITDASEYRNASRLWDAAHIDRMWINGAQVKVGTHPPDSSVAQVHGAAIVLHSLGEVITGSSNWTTPSANKQDEHNFFYSPGFGMPWFFQWFEDRFAAKWNDSTNFGTFVPKPPTSPQYSGPANGAGAQSTTSVTLKWEGGPWAHFYDIYFGTSSNPPLFASNQQLGSPNSGTSEKFTVSNLLPGTKYYWRIVSKTWAEKTNSGPVWNFTTSGTSGGGGGGGQPFGGTPAPVPGTIQAENFDNGGQNVGYFDTTSGNSLPAGYRSGTDVDIESSSDSGGGFDIGKTRAGEWLNYTVNVVSAGTYNLNVRIANIGTGGVFRVEVDGVDKTGAMSVPNTGGWQTWQTVTKSGISLTAGTHVVRLRMVTAGTSGGVGNYNWLSFTTASGTSAFNGTPASIPGVVQVENFDNGGQNVAYFDTTSGNAKGAYRSTDVDIEPTTDTGGGFNVAKTRKGEWLKYTVDVNTTDTYQLRARIANIGDNATFRVEVDGVDQTGPVAVPDTGDWQAWQTITADTIPLAAGRHVIRLVFLNAGTSGGVGNYNWLQFTNQ